MGKHMQNNTEEMIQQNFIKLYSTMEIHQITVRGICAEMGISRTTFYRYYDDVYAILEAIEDKVIDQLLAVKRDFIKLVQDCHSWHPKQALFLMCE